MNELFSTKLITSEDQYKKWCEFCDQHFLPMEHARIGDETFYARLQGVGIGNLSLSHVSTSGMRFQNTPNTIRSLSNKHEMLGLFFNQIGESFSTQRDRAVKLNPGDVILLNGAEPFENVNPGRAGRLVVQVPRDRLENLLGPSRNFTVLPMNSDLPTTHLAKIFFRDLICVHDRLTVDAAERMASVGTDLLIAAIAERMARETPKPLLGSVTVQRAKAFIEGRLSDPDLGPPQVAAAVGVSLRYLQTLFAQHGQYVADWIWRRRLEVAAQRLRDPACQHFSIAAIAFNCGFLNQAHFSRRFREHFSISPSDYRRSTSP